MILRGIRRINIFYTSVFSALLILFLAGIFLFPGQAIASGCTENNIEGYAWSDNVGWISFSCMNHYEEGEGYDYGVNFNRETGLFSGEAWNDEVGWISFDSGDLSGCPSGTCEARLVDGDLTGWAKVLSSDEWISLNGEDYGVNLDAPEFHGYAWGDRALGWINFNCSNESECGVNNYKVETTLHRLIVVTDLATIEYDEGADTATIEFAGRLQGMGGDTDADVWFEWGEGEAGMAKDISTEQTLTEEGAFYAEVVISEPQTENNYYYKAVAESSINTAEGVTRSFSLFTCNENNIRGYAWSDNIGWISFSCMNEYEIGQGVDYGVNLNDNTKLLSGQAWAENLGWISFDESDLVGCPEAPCEARVETVEVTGWAKVLAEDEEDEEWISLSGEADNGDAYGAELIVPDFHGYAWGDKYSGWISFNCENDNSCATSDYSVYTNVIKLYARTDPATIRYDEDTNVATVILNGMLLGTGGVGEADVWFEWGETEEAIEKDEESIQVMSSGGSFFHEITFENPQFGEVYYFRAAAESTERTTRGSVVSFELSQSEGDIIIRYKGEEKTIEINSEGRIEIIN